MDHFDSRPWEPNGYPRVVKLERVLYQDDYLPNASVVDFPSRRHTFTVCSRTRAHSGEVKSLLKYFHFLPP